MKSSPVERLVFSGSLVVFAFLYGWGAGALGWFPGPLVSSAFDQGSLLFGAPGYVVPQVYERSGSRVLEPSRVQPGSTLIATLWPDGDRWTAGLDLIDSTGATLHSWRLDPTELFSSEVRPRGLRLEDGYIHGAHLLADGDVVVNIEAMGSVRLDACSRPEWISERGNHHSIAMDDEGRFWIPVLEYWDEPDQIPVPARYPGLQAPLIDNRIVLLSSEGETLEEIAVLDVLFSNGLERRLAKTGNLSGDVLHLNDVEPLSDTLAGAYPLFEAGDLLVSLRNPNLIFVFDPDTRMVRWHASDPFIQQHDPDFVGDGWIGLFDNNSDGTDRGTMLGGSRIVRMQPHTDSVEIAFPTPVSEPFYTGVAGKWQLLANGNMLLTEALAGRIVEVAPDGRSVWDWVHEPYDQSSTVEVSEGTRYPLTAADVRSWPCSAPAAS